jgi:hypothetical protein
MYCQVNVLVERIGNEIRETGFEVGEYLPAFHNPQQDARSGEDTCLHDHISRIRL